MQIITWEAFLQNSIKISKAVSFTTGVFDGLHIGHKELLKTLHSYPNTTSVITTFKENPLLILNPKNFRGNILSLEQKINLFKQSGCEVLILIDFSLEFSKISGKTFFEYIKNNLNVSHVVLGHDHKIGNHGDLSAENAKKMLCIDGIEVDVVDPVMFEGKPVSSTRIRKAIIDGNLLYAEKLLGRKHSLDLSSISSLDYKISVLRKNDIKQVIPFVGQYAVKLNNGKETFATKIEITKDSILFEEFPDFKAETLTFTGL